MTAKVTPRTRVKITRLLVAGEPEPAIVANPGACSDYVIVCDHAGRTVPDALRDLGLPPEAFERHIALDIGAGAVSLLLGGALGATVIHQPYSRLVVDCNRAPDRADAIVEISDGTAIPGNVGLDPTEANARFAEIHAPYHRRIAEELDVRAAAGLRGAVVSIHSFTPEMNGRARPWLLGVLHENDSPLSKAMLEVLVAEEGLVVGDNEPYAMDGIDYTVPFHARGRGLDYLELEIRQDLIAEAAGQQRIAELLARTIPLALERARGG
jgi:predicted N-formylglutamate amidohydrolase